MSLATNIIVIKWHADGQQNGMKVVYELVPQTTEQGLSQGFPFVLDGGATI